MYLEEGRSLPLGVRAATAYTRGRVRLGPGSTLLLYTDGLIEKRGTPIDEGLARLAAVRGRRPRGPRGALRPAARRRWAPAGRTTSRCSPSARSSSRRRRLQLTMPAEPLTLASLRRALRGWLRQCEASDEEGYDIVLACNEAFANAIEHAYGPGDGSVEVDAALSGRARSRSRSATSAGGAKRRDEPRTRTGADRGGHGLGQRGDEPRGGDGGSDGPRARGGRAMGPA